jgi:hypothetical protein
MYTKYFITTLTAALISALPLAAANAKTQV